MQDELWNQARIAREFGVAAGTVQSAWRHATLRTLKARLVAAERPELVARADRMTRAEFDALRIGGLHLPNIALPLPDELIVNKPVWRAATVRSWAAATRRIDAHGRLRRSLPPGRQAGVREHGPRRRQPAAARRAEE